jgi:hypothetical protein
VFAASRRLTTGAAAAAFSEERRGRTRATLLIYLGHLESNDSSEPLESMYVDLLERARPAQMSAQNQ